LCFGDSMTFHPVWLFCPVHNSKYCIMENNQTTFNYIFSWKFESAIQICKLVQAIVDQTWSNMIKHIKPFTQNYLDIFRQLWKAFDMRAPSIALSRCLGSHGHLNELFDVWISGCSMWCLEGSFCNRHVWWECFDQTPQTHCFVFFFVFGLMLIVLVVYT
jgi:hypothetical protein